MLKSGIIDILKSFSKEEMREFRNFVRSPFFNTSQSVVKLFDQLRLYYPDFSSPGLDKKTVYKKIFGKAEYNEGLLRVMISNLTKLAREYLTLVNLRNNSFIKKISLLTELNIRKLEKHFTFVLKDAEQFLKTLPKTDMIYFLNKSFLNDNIYLFNQWSRGRPKGFKKQMSDVESMKNIIGDMTRYYLIASLLLIRKFFTINKKLNIDLNLPFTGDMPEVLESRINEFSDTPIIKLHLNEVLLLTKGGRKYFQALKQILINDTSIYNIIVTFSLHRILQIYADIQILKGKHAYRKEKLMLYKTAMNKDILRNPYVNYFDSGTFLSVVNQAAELNELRWREKYIAEYKKYLDPLLKDDLINISQSYILFKTKDYNRALELLGKVKTKKTELLISVKKLLLKIYYELNMFIEADMVIDTFRHLLPKAEDTYILEEFYHGDKNFLKYYSALLKAHEKNQPEKKLEVLKEVEKEFTIAERSWILEKVNEL